MSFAQHRAVELLARDIFDADPPSNPHGPDSDLEFGDSYVKTETERARRIAAHLVSLGYEKPQAGKVPPFLPEDEEG